MKEVTCINCGSENVYYSKKRQKYCCEDCEATFEIDEKDFIPQKVFISYGHDKNRVVVEEIKRKLAERGHNPWIDSSEIEEGSNWRSEISKGIYGSNEFLAFISQHSVRNPGVCLDEIAIALGRKECLIQTILLEKNVYPPNSIGYNQWLDFTDWESYWSEGERVWNDWLNKKMKKLYEVIENPDNITKSGEISDLIKKLQPITPRTILKNLLSKDIVQRKWLLDTAKREIEGEKKVFILIGRPGTGKSIFSALMSNYLYTVSAVYFIEWKNPDTQSARNLIHSIAFQIACSHRDYRESLIRVLLNERPEECSDATLCDKLIIDPLSELIDGNREKTVVIIDALDELKDNCAQDFLAIVERMIERTPSWCRFVITSRPEVNVLSRLKKYEPEYLDLHACEIQKDIYEFIGRKYDSREIIESIYKKSGGSFTYVGELMKVLNGREVAVELIEKMPGNIAALFYDNFERAIGKAFDDDYYKLLSAIVYSFEPLTLKFLARLLECDTRTVSQMLTPLNSYLHRDEESGKEQVSIEHKSLADWLTDPSNTKYYVEPAYAHSLFAKNLLKCYEEGEDFDSYSAKYGYDHILLSEERNHIGFEGIGKILEKSIQRLKRDGYLSDEKRLLDIYKEEGYDSIIGAEMTLDYSIRANGRTDRALCEFLYESGRSQTDGKKKYVMQEKAANAYFYLGEDERSYNILMALKEENGEIFEDPEYEAMWNHSISLPAHDMDYNEQVAKASETSARLYKEQDKRYEYFVSLVNHFDALMGCGKLKEAEECAEKVFKLNENNYYIHIDDILKICYANLLQVEGRIMEALQWYEEGLIQAKQIQEWDYLYGSVWRELAVAKFGDATCLNRLEDFIRDSRFQDFTYVVSLGECFYILSSWLLKTYDPGKLKEYYGELKTIGLVGHNLQALIALELIGEETGEPFFDRETFLRELDKNIGRAQGIKGLPEVIHAFFRKHGEERSQKELEWYQRYIVPVVNFQERCRNDLLQSRTDKATPYFRKTSCIGCEAKCCYDGVYLRNAEEEKRIARMIREYPEYFAHIPEDYIVAGDWPGMEQYRKTLAVPHEYKSKDFPAHFEKTTCVFTMENGECLLQRVATDKQLHPWYAKPAACWAFPIRAFSKEEGKVLAPTGYGEKDPDALGESYPGYVTCLPCGKPVCPEEVKEKDADSWTNYYKNEIEYYDYLFRNDRV